ncbi:MAG: hypothetical protein LBH62_03720 [Nitrososphaerota archaeon]|jgi:hypothetical protein|uniref:hypothetical protein n=1 Tax=Candidatus Bathycorpusculum sp. TaxID=2994959 RepID=UPI002832538E|nr:hypothetical protein [Candidatus Termiticorpusculum sp.]MCL2256877.1 hypothetical protein [Candidatus Termiticorpusculum sp.]MCL2292981.1 hypothetical protein [Candidatus Termiticorpusculum sp.]MDR0460534.1 hypothetical protein [Nitrososphaerota archaeon]
MAQNNNNINTKKNVENKIIRVQIKNKPEPSPPVITSSATAALYSEEDVRKIVNEFVTSWIKGDLIIRFPTANELGKQNPLSLTLTKDPSVNAELKIKEHYIDLILICAGVKHTSIEEQQKAISEVFKMMLMFRSANRIENQNITKDIEKRFTDLEKTQQNQMKLVEQITAFLFKPKKPKQQKTKN